MTGGHLTWSASSISCISSVMALQLIGLGVSGRRKPCVMGRNHVGHYHLCGLLAFLHSRRVGVLNDKAEGGGGRKRMHDLILELKLYCKGGGATTSLGRLMLRRSSGYESGS